MIHCPKVLCNRFSKLTLKTVAHENTSASSPLTHAYLQDPNNWATFQNRDVLRKLQNIYTKAMLTCRGAKLQKATTIFPLNFLHHFQQNSLKLKPL